MSHQGGSLEDMAKDGTTIPGDAGKQRIIPSVPNPHQLNDTAGGGLGSATTHDAADNPTDLPAPGDKGASASEAITGTGDQLPAASGSKASGSGGK